MVENPSGVEPFRRSAVLSPTRAMPCFLAKGCWYSWETLETLR